MPSFHCEDPQWNDRTPLDCNHSHPLLYKVNETISVEQKVQKFAQDQAVQDLSEKAWSKWQLFDTRQQSLYSKDPAKLAAYVDRSDQTYQKNLLAFVMQNLLPGKYMSQLSNGQDIQDLIKEISVPMAPPPGAPPPAPGAPPAGTNTPENQLVLRTRLWPYILLHCLHRNRFWSHPIICWHQ